MLASKPARRETTRYVQLAETFRRQIAEGKWTVGERLPTVAALASAHGVAKITVRQAMDILAREALISRSPGRGTHVTATPPFVRFQNLRADWSSFMHGGGTTEVIGEWRCVQLPKGAAEPYASDELFDHLRVIGRRAKGVPVSLRNVYVVQDIFDEVRARLSGDAVINVLADYATEIVIYNQIHTASAETAALLQVHIGAPLLTGRHVGLDAKKRVMFVDFPSLRGDQVKYEIRLRRDAAENGCDG